MEKTEFGLNCVQWSGNYCTRMCIQYACTCVCNQTWYYSHFSVIMCRFFKKIDAFNSLLPPDQAAQRRESSFAPYNSHYIVAVLSPILFIMMIMMSVLMMVLKKTWATYVFISISAPVSCTQTCTTGIYMCHACAAEMCPTQIFLNIVFYYYNIKKTR